MTRIPAVMISVRGREAEAEITRSAATTVGVSVERVFRRDDLPIGCANAAINGRDAFTWVAEQRWGPWLFLEDDVSLAVEWTRARIGLTIAACQTAVVLYCPNWRWYPAPMRRAIADGASIRYGIHDGVGRGQFYCSQAVLFASSAIAGEIAAGWPVHRMADIAMRRVFVARADFRIAVPNPARHRLGRSGDSTWSPGSRPNSSRCWLGDYPTAD